MPSTPPAAARGGVHCTINPNRNIDRREFLAALSWGMLAIPLGAIVPCARISGAPARRGAAVSTGYAFDPRFANYYQNDTEVKDRVLWIDQQLHAAGLTDQLAAIAPFADPMTYIAQVHTAAHIAGIQSYAVETAMGATEKMGDIAELAAAYVIGAVRDVLDNKVRAVFCNIRPPGHHQSNTGSSNGFCCYANVAIAAAFARKVSGVNRILIVDWDFHHGNGTQFLVCGDQQILFFDTFGSVCCPPESACGDFVPEAPDVPLTPGDLRINVSMPGGSDNDAFVNLFQAKLVPAADAFKPDLILISCGFDLKGRDCLGNFGVTAQGVSRLTRIIMDLADAHCGGRLVSILEGGYCDAGGMTTFQGLAECAENHVRTLMTGTVQAETPFYAGAGVKHSSSTRTGNGPPAVRGGVLHLPAGGPVIDEIVVTDSRGAVVHRSTGMRGGSVDLRPWCGRAGAYAVRVTTGGEIRVVRWKVP